jgi:hypothetical protein
VSRRLNVDRMRRYVARTTPDLKRFVVDPIADDAQAHLHAEIRRWADRMAVKHPDRPTIDLRQWDDVATFGVVVEGRVRL